MDLLILHWPIPGKVVDTWRVMEELYYSGRVRALGLSNVQRYHHLDIEQNCEIMAHVQQDSYNPFAEVCIRKSSVKHMVLRLRQCPQSSAVRS